MTPPRRCWRSGSAVVELAFSMPVLVGLFLGTLQFGYSFYIDDELEQAVRAGARYASLRSYASSSATPNASYTDAVRNVVVYADPAGGTQPVAPGLTTAHVIITMTMQNGAPAAVTVAIDGYSLPMVISSIVLTNKPSTRFPYLGVFSPPAS